jgi:hypothetical protein
MWNVMDSPSVSPRANPMSARREMMTTSQIYSFFPKLSPAILLSGFRDLRSPSFSRPPVSLGDRVNASQLEE